VLRTLLATGIVTGTRRSEHITPVLARFHWLKMAERIEYKIALLTFKTLTTGKPDYLSGQLCAPVRQLRLSDRTNRLYFNSHQTTFACRAFRNPAPVVWNSQPHRLTDDLPCTASFRRNLKTHLSTTWSNDTQCVAVNVKITRIISVTYEYYTNLFNRNNKLPWIGLLS